ncbi:MAG TPA: hypothetical protein VNW06_05925, partial [Cytophagaceae bacterium]|nr:hypothetical protein [Cytophagaceae bacterium]
MKKNFPILVLAFLVISCSKNKESQSPVEQNFSVEGKEVIIYTTADSSDLRLTNTGKKTFQPAEQALEKDVSVFVNPNVKFQSLLGIG